NKGIRNTLAGFYNGFNEMLPDLVDGQPQPNLPIDRSYDSVAGPLTEIGIDLAIASVGGRGRNPENTTVSKNVDGTGYGQQTISGTLNGESAVIGTRPTPRQSEIDVGNTLPEGTRSQVSYLNGQEVPYGTRGSVRPDFCVGNSCSIEVKNYNVQTNQNGLVNNVVQQAFDRANNLPTTMTQTVTIDVRGQTLTPAIKQSIIDGIYKKSNGIILPNQITFFGE
ncbi:hypothetical protein, partial [Formosimonas limnophila]|uniref:hypothetical protein n=1 Tax=Formosimonas limnophila TaxID=1384487 RepID=UPI0016755AA4